ncbi:GNAT family N-acetyltransferase [Streptomyces sp. NEAU-H3]|uniref:GNAT family N-acetyltransferase n=1 Tax=Streptomyces sp. NEAU-H3 TaxID=2720636 RepID=UPI0014394910|nr:GNAT family N-acetyltransferase [Streptomyces sp. NEAU-H3]NJA56761.1 GNAT family N-acetyltransferase [Streptomyces sp. NEAU-H3]
MASGPVPPSGATDPVVARVEWFHETVARECCRVRERYGPFVLHLQPFQGAFPARPHSAERERAFTAAEVRDLLRTQRERQAPRGLEWLAETAPALRAACEEAGLVVREHPVLLIDPCEDASGEAACAPAPGARLLASRDWRVEHAIAVAHVGFAYPGTGRGPEGRGSVAELLASGDLRREAAEAARRIHAGTRALAIAETQEGPVATGQFNTLDDLAEIIAVATLPEARRRGHASAVLRTLIAEARSRRLRTMFLTAADEEVARIYESVGFKRLATVLEAVEEGPTGGA